MDPEIEVSESDPVVEGTEAVDEVAVPEAEPQTWDWSEHADALVAVKVDGEDVRMTVKEAMASAMRQADYTRKTQELAAQREQLSRAEMLVKALEADPQTTLATLAKVYGAQPEVETEDLDPIEARIRAIEKAEQERAQEAQRSAYRTEAENAIRAQGLEGVSSDELFRFAIDNEIGRLDVAAKLMRQERIAAKAAETEKVVESKRAASVVEGKGRPTGGNAPATPTSLAASFEAALRTHNVNNW